ncbi:MAG: CBS domain-containing protein [Verrucomicrobia bacterium]|nr:CBS domain-containing protein [Verrucomicrobiota bacterium]
MNTPVAKLVEAKQINTISASPDTTVFEAVGLMTQHRIGALLVRDGTGAPVGIFSERDCFSKVLLAEKSPRQVRIGEVMSRDLVTTDASRSVEDCLAVMNERHIRHLPVMKGREVLGLISMRDVVRHLVEERGQMIHNLEKYIGGAM